MKTCPWLWHSHGCTLPEGHADELHVCGDDPETGWLGCYQKMRVLPGPETKDGKFPSAFLHPDGELAFITTAWKW